MRGAAVSVVMGLVLLYLGRWGLARQGDLVAASLSVERRQKELRAIRRGARSCLVLGVVFVAFAVLQGTAAVVGG